MISGSAKVDARSRTPLFHVQPNGCPSMAQTKSGLPSFTASCCAGTSETCHGMVVQASFEGRSSLSQLARVSFVSSGPLRAGDNESMNAPKTKRLLCIPQETELSDTCQLASQL